jgi:hypothetical protein
MVTIEQTVGLCALTVIMAVGEASRFVAPRRAERLKIKIRSSV